MVHVLLHPKHWLSIEGELALPVLVGVVGSALFKLDVILLTLLILAIEHLELLTDLAIA